MDCPARVPGWWANAVAEITLEMSALAGSFYTTPKRFPTVSGQPAVQLCKANPLRWGLVLGICNASGSGGTQCNIGVTSDVGDNKGFGLVVGSPWVLNYRNHPSLVTLAWYAGAIQLQAPTVEVLEELAQQ